jgi:hypothetical protein
MQYLGLCCNLFLNRHSSQCNWLCWHNMENTQPGGIWINLGPLLYHLKNLTNGLSIELSFEDIKMFFCNMNSSKRWKKNMYYQHILWRTSLWWTTTMNVSCLWSVNHNNGLIWYYLGNSLVRVNAEINNTKSTVNDDRT